MSSPFNLSPCFTIVLTRISSVFEKLISRPAFLDSFQRSSSFLHICSYLWDARHTSSAYSISSSDSCNLQVNPLFFPSKALHNTPSITSRNNNGDRRQTWVNTYSYLYNFKIVRCRKRMQCWCHKLSCIALSIRWKVHNTWRCGFIRAADVCCMVLYSSFLRYDMSAGHFDA